jgi:hypothetical protein
MSSAGICPDGHCPLRSRHENPLSALVERSDGAVFSEWPHLQKTVPGAVLEDSLLR